MKLKNFLREGIVQKALDIPEPEVGGDYPSEKVKRYQEIIDKALEAMKNKENNDANDAIVADLRDKKKKWGSVDKETKPTKTKTEIPPEQQQDDDPDVKNPPPEGEEPPPEEEPKDEPKEEEPPEEDEEEKDKKKKKKVPPQFQKKEDYEFKLMTPFEKAMKEQEDPVTGKRCYVFHRHTNGKKKRKNKKMRENMEEGIFDKKMASMKADIEKKYGKSGSKLVDKIYNQLMKIPEFKNLSMDRQGEISVAVQKMIGR